MGKMVSPFKASRVLTQQGNPLSLLFSFFFPVADVLDRLTDRAREIGLVDRFLDGRDGVCVSHLQYIDNAVFFLQGRKVW